MKHYDCLVLGAGPAGLAATLYLTRFGLSVALVEKLTPGGMLLQTHVIENYPGVKSAKGYELTDSMVEQAAEYPYDNYAADVTKLRKDEAGYVATLSGAEEETLHGRVALLCSGLEYRKLGLPDEVRLTGHGVSYCALCDGNFFRNQVVGVVGGGNSALEESLYLATLVKELHLIHRRDSFRAAKIYQDRIRAMPNVTIHFNSVVEKLEGEDTLTGVLLRSTADGSVSALPLNGLFVFAGHIPAGQFLPKDLEVDETGFVLTDTEMRTNLPGLFAAGDIRSKLCKQVATAVGDGVTAANSAYAYLEKH